MSRFFSSPLRGAERTDLSYPPVSWLFLTFIVWEMKETSAA